MITLRNRTADPARTSMWRSRWAAIGAAIAVSLGAGGMLVAQAAPGASESTIVTVTPERIMDTRDPVNVGLAGPFVSPVSQKLRVTGSVATTTGTKTVVPVGATGVLLNVTAAGPSAAGFISIRPGDATGAPATSSLNVDAGKNLPNAVQVALPTTGDNAGKIDITYDAYGVAGPTTDILIDVVGYMTNTGLQELVADVATKASTTYVNAGLAATRATAFNAGGNDFTNTTVTLGSMSLSNDRPCTLLMSGTSNWDQNGVGGVFPVFFLQWRVDGANVGGSFADQENAAADVNDSLSAIASTVIAPGAHTIELRGQASTGTVSVEDTGGFAQCIPFDGSGNPVVAGVAEVPSQSVDDPNDPTD